MDIKEFWRMVLSWFTKKNFFQKALWIIYLVVYIYEFFVTPTRFELFGFTLISLPVVLILDYLFSKL